MTGWNFADVWEHHADRFPDAPAQIWGDRHTTWREFDERADGLAATFLRSGAVEQDKVALYLYNRPEYLETTFATFKAGLVPVNTNYRYGREELAYLWENSDAVAVVFEGCFADRVEAVRSRLPGLRTFVHVDDGSGPCPDWAISYEDAAASASGRTLAPWGRSGDHLFILYTGGTTGMPKGVMWRQDDLLLALDGSNRNPLPAEVDWAALTERVTKPGPINLPAAPLMHGTGGHNALSNLLLAGCIVTTTGRSFDPIDLLETIAQHRVKSISIVGDAFANPILRALDAEPDRFDISSLRVIVSSGVMWSAENKAGLLRHNPRLIMVDALGSSEAISMATSTTTAATKDTTATFRPRTDTVVLSDDGRIIQPGTGERGRLAQPGRLPVGYYKDQTKSAATFQTVNGVRYSIPGDWAEVDADGTIRLLGRGSQCINTGGEKVYPEEVEEALKLHPSVADAAVVGLPDERFGQAICALVEPTDAAAGIDVAELIAHVKAKLSAFKAPKRIVTVASIGRAANGKLDHKALTTVAENSL
jgi:3-oxocholest-4-en-26-oate---CoA ligase